MCGVTCCTIKSKRELVTTGRIYRSLCCLADDFILSHIYSWSKAECYLIIGDFNEPYINWIEPTASGRSFDSDLLSIIRCALEQCVAKPTHIDFEHDPSLLDLVLTNHCDDFVDIQHPHQQIVVMYFTLGFGRTVYSMYLIHPVPISGEQTFRQSETMLSRQTGRSMRMN